MKSLDRRSFVKSTTLATAGALAAPGILRAGAMNADEVRIAFIGTGLRGRNHVNNLLDYPGVQCPCICDIDPDAIAKTVKIFQDKGLEAPRVFTGDELAYRQMLEEMDIDGVIIATNWKWHTGMCLDAMKAGVYVGTEVSGAFSIDECWDLVETHQRTGTHLMFLENVNYRRDVMAVMNMVRDGVFGELVHCRGGYQHDLLQVKFNDGDGGLVYGEGAYGEARWRTEHSLRRNAELYPTHGLGPISSMLDVNRGNRMTTISSFATKSKSIDNFIRKHEDGGDNHPYRELDWKLGDIVTSTIATANGQTIILTHDTNLPRPYSLGFRVQGLEGLCEFDYHTRRVYVDKVSESHRWDGWEVWFDKYDHPLWREFEDEALNKGHGGMDFFVDRAFAESVKRNSPAVMDVYDAAVWRAITPLSEASIRNGGAPQEIPDFTEGRWMCRKPLFAVGDL